MCFSSCAPSRKRQIVEFLKVTPEVWVRSVERNVPRITFLAHTVGRWFLDFWKICGPLLRAPCYIGENRSFASIVSVRFEGSASRSSLCNGAFRLDIDPCLKLNSCYATFLDEAETNGTTYGFSIRSHILTFRCLWPTDRVPRSSVVHFMLWTRKMSLLWHTGHLLTLPVITLIRNFHVGT